MQLLPALRYAVFAVVLASAFISLAAWAVRTRQVNPFSPFGRVLRRISEPFVRRVETILVGNGANPQNAPWWIFGATLIVGIALIGTANWLVRQTAIVSGAASSGRGLARIVVFYAGQLLLLALFVRVIGSWLGQYRYSRWMRPFYLLTDWLVEPLRKIIPPLGGFDITPMVAWLALQYLIIPLLLSVI